MGDSGDKILLGSSQNGIKLILNFIIQYMIVCLYGLILLYSVLCTRLTHEIHHVIMAWHYQANDKGEITLKQCGHNSLDIKYLDQLQILLICNKSFNTVFAPYYQFCSHCFEFVVLQFLHDKTWHKGYQSNGCQLKKGP